ncbi:MBL fold metallo-hydrolase [Streptomyces tsukubensis]|uniref:MBL fold metallo-hydrolase n=1 Tax=Streptomyces tsukubensis TaxID=83656 RepID=UPI001E520364|nr:MBL fold metallo-hydrolase [Streptomyces tsukubensis]
MTGLPSDAPQPATPLTRDLNAAVVVPPDDQDPESALAAQGLISPLPPDFAVDRAGGPGPAWSLAPYTFLTGASPDTVNPSLWRNALLNMKTGLFEVVPDAVYQVRGMDLSNISFLEDPTGVSPKVVVVDPLISEECAAAAWKLYRENRKLRDQERTICAVIFTHSHIDHYGGVLGLFEDGQVPTGVEIIAPEGFLEHSVSENVYAGNAMLRRAMFMYGTLLERSEKGQVDAGLGKTMSAGATGLLPPTCTVTPEVAQPGHVVAFGPVNLEFQLTPGTEAPGGAEFLSARRPGAVHGGERHPDPAQPLQPARRPGEGRKGVVAVSEPVGGVVRGPVEDAVRLAFLAPVEHRGVAGRDRVVPDQPGGPVPVPARSGAAAGEPGPDDDRDRRGPRRQCSGESDGAVVQPGLLRHGQP